LSLPKATGERAPEPQLYAESPNRNLQTDNDESGKACRVGEESQCDYLPASTPPHGNSGGVAGT